MNREAALGIGWLVLLVGLARFGALLLPRSLAAMLTLESYLSIVLLLSTGAGVVAAFVTLSDARASLGIRDRLRASHMLIALLCAPIVLVVSAYLGYRLALPTLIEELTQGGRQAVERNTGELGRTLVQAHLVTTLLWAIVLTPIGEELLFRGMLWSAISRRLGGWLATLLTTVLFTLLHADQPGGAGIVRAVQAGVLGAALGGARHASGGIAAPMMIHAAFNLLSIAKLRRWVVSPGWPPPLPIATLYWQLAGLCAGMLAVGFALAKRFRVSVEVTTHLRVDPEEASARVAALDIQLGEMSVEAEGDGTAVRWVQTRAIRSLPLYLAALWQRRALKRAMRAELARLHDRDALHRSPRAPSPSEAP